MTEKLFETDSYLKECEAEIIAVNDLHGIILSQTVFYPTGGGQPGDSGSLQLPDGSAIEIATTIKADGSIIHVPAEADAGKAKVGDKVMATINWDRRYNHMRMHTSLHVLCACVAASVTGGQIGEAKSRLDFDISALEGGLDKQDIEAKLNAFIAEGHDVSVAWITDEELAAQPELVRTMSVSPPSGSGKVRLLKIGEAIDLQPCGGTHIKNLSEIGGLQVGKIENKGAKNRRVNILLKDA